MTSNDEAIVFVDFEIDRRDLFRANMELAKWRFLTGVILVLTFVLPLGYFFTIIGEQTILLQTSPLFVGLPLVALGGQVLRLQDTTRKYVSALSTSQRQLQYVFQSSSDGYDSISGGSFSHTVWKDVMQVVEKPGYFLIYRNRFEAGILPKRGFQPANIPVFRDIVRSKLGSCAKVSTP
ncbi:MAG: YcxB family protein [Acidobacteriota bacterium]|nr:YcxB family protein [Acidobacteriota bacterium]